MNKYGARTHFTDSSSVQRKERVWWQFECLMVYFVQLNRNQPVAVYDVLQILRLHISVPQCDIFGYLSIDNRLVVLVAPVDHQPTLLQVIHKCSYAQNDGSVFEKNEFPFLP